MDLDLRLGLQGLAMRTGCQGSQTQGSQIQNWVLSRRGPELIEEHAWRTRQRRHHLAAH